MGRWLGGDLGTIPGRWPIESSHRPDATGASISDENEAARTVLLLVALGMESELRPGKFSTFLTLDGGSPVKVLGVTIWMPWARFPALGPRRFPQRALPSSGARDAKDLESQRHALHSRLVPVRHA